MPLHDIGETASSEDTVVPPPRPFQIERLLPPGSDGNTPTPGLSTSSALRSLLMDSIETEAADSDVVDLCENESDVDDDVIFIGRSSTDDSSSEPTPSDKHRYNTDWERGRWWLMPVADRKTKVVYGMFCTLCQSFAFSTNKHTERVHKKVSVASISETSSRAGVAWVATPCTSLTTRAVTIHEAGDRHLAAVESKAGQQDVHELILNTRSRNFAALVACFRTIYFSAQHKVCSALSVA